MPSDSRRRKALDGMVTTLQTITVAAGYEFDLSGTGVVSKTVETLDARIAQGVPITVRVRDGEERFKPTHLARGRTGQFRILVDVLMQTQSTEDMVDQVNDLIRDIHQAINAHKDLSTSGAIADSNVEVITQPAYDADNAIAAVGLVVLAEYDYTAGQAGGL